MFGYTNYKLIQLVLVKERDKTYRCGYNRT